MTASKKKSKIKTRSIPLTNRERRLQRDLKLSQAIQEIIDQVTDNVLNIEELSDEAKYLEIVNRAKTNKYLNMCLTSSMDSLIKIQGINNFILNKISGKKNIITTKESTKTFLKLKELENEQVKLITELSKTQQFVLDEREREILIIYRSIPEKLQLYMYETILEFIKQCPKIQKAMLKTKQEQLEKEQKEEKERKEVEKLT